MRMSLFTTTCTRLRDLSWLASVASHRDAAARVGIEKEDGAHEAILCEQSGRRSSTTTTTTTTAAAAAAAAAAEI